MFIKILMVLLCVNVTLAADGGNSIMNEWLNSQIQSFKQEIGYEQALQSISPDSGIMIDWPEPGKFPELAEDWQLRGDSVYLRQGGASREWVLEKGEQEIAISVFVSSTGPETAWLHLLDIASNTMMVNIPFQKSRENLGDLAVVSRGERVNAVLWVYSNVCISIERNDSDFDILSLAGALQSVMERHLITPLREHLPKIKRIELSSPQVKLGQPVFMTIVPEYDSDPKRLIIDYDMSGNSLGAVSQDDLVLEFVAEEPGDSTVTIGIVDRNNLLSVSVPVKVKVEMDNQ